MIRTPRLVLRPWRASDLAPFAEQNADPLAMRLLGGTLSRAASDAFVERQDHLLARVGFCVWAVEAPGVSPFIGAVGLAPVNFRAAFAPAVEVAWRLDRRFWRRGYATEAARAAIADGFGRVGLAEIVAFTSLVNGASIGVMQRIGMIRRLEFDHPNLPDGHVLRRHVLYRTRLSAGVCPRVETGIAAHGHYVSANRGRTEPC